MGALQSYVEHPESEEANMDPAEPTRHVRAILLHLGLPAELVLEIMEIAEYYPTVCAKRADTITVYSDQHTPRNYCSALLYLVSSPLPDCREGESWKPEKVTWIVEGHDQGWAGQRPVPGTLGTFRSAFSWYEACIFRPRPEYDGLVETPDDLDVLKMNHLYRKPEDIRGKIRWDLVPNGNSLFWRVQCNQVARRDFKRYVVEWRAGEAMDAAEAEEKGHGTGLGFLEALRPGDRVGLWVRAMNGGWSNVIREATFTFMYDVQQ